MDKTCSVARQAGVSDAGVPRPPHAVGDPLHSPQAQESEGHAIPRLAGTRGAASGRGPSPAGSIERRAVHPDRDGHRAPLPQQEADISGRASSLSQGR
ncbi:hypothetical protein NDU88_001333 [Pleurodeles waltl]|uniref:Uncharacterized protein n=1 Tax=Pleurodeles waltl TaxID=8319 RepID=A0AAV7NEG5_PLEWA|nr:hypothetical protein NDU88_001333 [Pleurodeles waltl]